MQFIILVSLGLLLSACGGSGDSSPAGNSGGGTPITGLSINTSAIIFSPLKMGNFLPRNFLLLPGQVPMWQM